MADNNKMTVGVNADYYHDKAEDLGEYMDVAPTGYRGRRIFPQKNNPDNLANAQSDIRDFYGLDNEYGLDENGK